MHQHQSVLYIILSRHCWAHAGCTEFKFYCFCLMSCRGIRQWANVQNLERHCGGECSWSANVWLCHPFQVGSMLHFTHCFSSEVNSSFFSAIVLELCVFTGGRTGSQFTQQMWSSSRESSSSIRSKCVICFTWSSLWTQIQMSDCLAEVLTSSSHTRIHTQYSRCCHSAWMVWCYFPLVLRDMNRGRDLEQILTQYTTFVKPAFEEFCLPVSMMVITDCVPVIQFHVHSANLLQWTLSSASHLFFLP